MPVDSIPGVQFIEDTHRCYSYALDFVVASAALGKYLNAYYNQTVTSFAPDLSTGVPQYPSVVFAGAATGRTRATTVSGLIEFDQEGFAVNAFEAGIEDVG